MQALRNDPAIDLQAIESIVSHSRPGGPIIWDQAPSAVEKFRLLAHRLHRARTNKSIQTVLVTSATSDEGKSTVAVNLATIFARNGARALLIDSDFRVPDLHKIFNLRSLPGLHGVLTGEVTLEAALCRIDPVGLYFLPAGDSLENPLPLLESSSFAGVLSRARETFEWVIVDSPPLNPLADAQCIAALVDAILLVVRWGFTPREELAHALATLNGLPLLGLVLNRFDGWQESYHYSHSIQPALTTEVSS